MLDARCKSVALGQSGYADAVPPVKTLPLVTTKNVGVS